jgi:isoamylase
LNDMVSYNDKHNLANGEGNRDGIDNNLSWNCGVEGPSDDPAVDALRRRQIRNAMTLLMLSRGVPMMVAGDEIRRTQGGNNNAYNQDNATGWIDWALAESQIHVLRFVQRIIAFRKAHPSLSRPCFYTGAFDERGLADIIWHGTRLHSPGFDDPEARALACTIAGVDGSADLHLMMNMFWEPLEFDVPAIPERTWRVAIDTFAESPHDIAAEGQEPPFIGSSCTVQARSIVVLSYHPTASPSLR